jgi:large subunit ribosomal protein L28
MHQGLWGGEGLIEGKIKKAKYRSPVPAWWIPNFFKTVVYSEILDKYLSVVVTDRALELIDSHTGLDSYLLKVFVVM